MDPTNEISILSTDLIIVTVANIEPHEAQHPSVWLFDHLANITHTLCEPIAAP